MIVVELRAANPIVGLRLLGNRLFRSANGVTFGAPGRCCMTCPGP